MALIKLEIWA